MTTEKGFFAVQNPNAIALVQQLADKNYKLLRADPFHPSLHFKKVGKRNHLWSVRVGAHYRALGLDKSEGVIWFWIGTHAEYDKLIA